MIINIRLCIPQSLMIGFRMMISFSYAKTGTDNPSGQSTLIGHFPRFIPVSCHYKSRGKASGPASCNSAYRAPVNLSL